MACGVVIAVVCASSTLVDVSAHQTAIGIGAAVALLADTGEATWLVDTVGVSTTVEGVALVNVNTLAILHNVPTVTDAFERAESVIAP